MVCRVGVEVEASWSRNPEAGVVVSLSFLSIGLEASCWSSSRFMMDCRLDMAAVVVDPGRHSDKVSNCMYTARLICAPLEECVMEITMESGKTES